MHSSPVLRVYFKCHSMHLYDGSMAEGFPCTAAFSCYNHGYHNYFSVQTHAWLVYSCSLAGRAWSDLCDALQVQYKLHAILHTVACACVLIMGLSACPDDVSHNNLKCFTRTFPGVALASIMPSLVLYFVEAWHRMHFLRSQKTA